MPDTLVVEKTKCRRCGATFIPKNHYIKVCNYCKNKPYEPKPPVVIPPTPEQEVTSLTEELKIKVCKMLACFTPIIRIQTYFLKEYNIHLAYQTIKHIDTAKKWEPIISRLRHEWIDNIQAVPVANRRYRLEAYDEIYNEAMEHKKYSTAMRALAQASEEMDERKLGGTSYTLNYISTMTDDELAKRKEEIINRIKRIPKLKNEPLNVEVENAIDEIGTRSNGFDEEGIRREES